MPLVTLGRLELTGANIRREKPLLLLAYLALEGAKPRRFIAELFWPEAADPLNSLSAALTKLRKFKAIQADEVRVWTPVECDAVALRRHLGAGDLSEAIELYQGPFVEGISEELGSELEDWVYATRDSLVSEVRLALITLAEREAASGQFVEAGASAEKAYRLPSLKALEAEELTRIYRLLLAAEHPAREALEREAKELGVSLTQSSEAARGRLRQNLIGRKRELEALLALEPGQWAWVRGGHGMGKTTLLRELEPKGWRYLPARSGLPYATLEPLLENLEGGEEVLMRRIAKGQQDLLLDDWEATDPESQRVLARLRSLRPDFRVVLGGVGEAPFVVDARLELGSLSPKDLAQHPGAYEATDGLPTLVGAWLRAEPMEMALETRLATLSEEAKAVYMALALLEEPDASLVREALDLSASAFSQTQVVLVGSGLIEPSGQIRARPAALNYLQSQPNLKAKIALRLARQLKGEAALPLYRQSKTLWEEADLKQVRQAYLAWGKELMKRGFPQRAAEALAEISPTPEIGLFRARALERAGQYKEALEVLVDVPDSHGVKALMGTLFWRLGKAEKAREAAQDALAGDERSRAEALNTLGWLAISRGEFKEAATSFRKAAALWLTLGEEEFYVGSLNNQAIARSEMGESTEEAFREALQASEGNTALKSRVLSNLGRVLANKGAIEEAVKTYHEAASYALEAGVLETSIRVWNNLGVLHHRQNQKAEAEEAYRQTMALARQAGETLFLGMALGNLAELTEDFDSLEEAIELLERGGYSDMAERFRQEMLDLKVQAEQRLLHLR